MIPGDYDSVVVCEAVRTHLHGSRDHARMLKHGESWVGGSDGISGTF